MFALLACFATSTRNFVTLTPDTYNLTVKNNPAVLVRYFTLHQETSVRSTNDYDIISQKYANVSDIIIAGLDCGKYHRECLKHHVFTLPYVRLYYNQKQYKYEGGFSHDSIEQFVYNVTGIMSQEVEQLIYSPNARTFRQMIKDNHCVLGFFHTPWCGACKRFMPRLQRVARLFKDEPRVKFAEIDSDRYRSFLREYELRTYPEIRLFVKGERKPIEYDGKRSPALVTQWINRHCDTDKEMTNIDNEVGLIDEANAVLEEFFNNGRKPMYIQRMKSVPRAGFYAQVMDGLLKNGEEWILEQKSKLQDFLESETSTAKEKDILKKKINIISFFQELIAFST